jgi:hypothetical protein
MGMTPEQVAELLGKAKTRGGYVTMMNEFLASGEAGVCVNEQWPELKEKKAATLKQGFDNAKLNKNVNAGADDIKVIANDDLVYLINAPVAGVAVDGNAAQTEAPTEVAAV